ncbi:hypothetical protein CXK91_18250 [Stutzerimonas stutzeri]|uniref:N-acetyltransferase domain-containing protein n=1 Tax=Stutzerimonas stutzeri TaxID=316 RepID=A0A2S4AIP7_STUST|nr:hypothetical protein CXK91_18250 [Stutzerimonas stutzeri]
MASPQASPWGLIDKEDLRTAHIYQMWVPPELRGKGIAKSLLGEIEAWAISRGCGLMALAVTTSNEAAVSFYRSFGFVAAGQPEDLRVGSALMAQPMICRLKNSA